MAPDSHARLQQALVGAAERRIVKAGLAALKARELAEEVGCALGMIYKVFQDLDAIILTVNLNTLETLDLALSESTRLDAAEFIAPNDRREVRTLVRLALAYFDFAADNELRWRAVFEHEMPDGQVVPEAHLEAHKRLFAYIEEPLRAIVPDADEAARMLLGRSLFSAVHGVVDLGLKEKLVAVPRPLLRHQAALITAAAARGLSGIPKMPGGMTRVPGGP
jgi:AcrR family transcriptional regulator